MSMNYIISRGLNLNFHMFKIKINCGYSFFELKNFMVLFKCFKLLGLTNLNLMVFKMSAVKVVDKKWKELSVKIR